MTVKEMKELLVSTMKSHVKGLPLIGAKLVPDPIPMAPPVGFVKQPSMVEVVRNMVRSERLRAEVEAAGYETFDESDDFDIGDDYDPSSPYEEFFDPVEVAVNKKLTDAEFGAKVRERLGVAQSRIRSKENVSQGRDQGRGTVVGSGVGVGDQVSEGKSGSKSQSSDARGVSQAAIGSGAVES